MKNLRLTLAIIAGKILIYISRLLGHQGTSFPGRIARKIYPRILRTLSPNIRREIVVITGTNGKTTTSNMLAEILKQQGYSLVHNRLGANMLSGITTAFIEKSDIHGSRKFDYALLETDEATVPLLLRETRPRLVLITNFFQDQLDRYGEMDHTIKLIQEAVKEQEIEMLLNADDPLTANFQAETGLKCWYYGFDDSSYDDSRSMDSREARYCAFCGHQLEYEKYHYAQLGQYSCPRCHSRNPERDFTGQELEMSPDIELKVDGIALKSPYQGFHNAYNILAAVSLARLLGVEDENIKKAIASFKPQAGRMEAFFINGKRVVLALVKNPAALNQTLASLIYDPGRKNLFFALNDNAADGRDISWIWDADVELLEYENVMVEQIVCSGQRSGDLALRFKYAGFPQERIRIEEELPRAIELAVQGSAESSYILCSYTALFGCQRILREMQKRSGTGEEAEKAYQAQS
ncbi:Mur ligase family protein [Syntrophomonas wolfei]|jgi:UDP-N-acetylmuramyl tripeptide synthase|uniref:Mur ligase family protein n=1 Tax=Syntrophomonas wolfei TaxID=863 RepID=UPI0023F3661F|nr:Mur ligase family protein [Syntrophomonas wolfei]